MASARAWATYTTQLDPLLENRMFSQFTRRTAYKCACESSHLTTGVVVLLSILGIVAIAYVGVWVGLVLAQRRRTLIGPIKLQAGDCLIGFVTNFFDALGIGNFAPTTAAFKLRHRMPDEQIPGTLNVGHALPVLTEAFIFISLITVDLRTLVCVIAAAAAGAWLGVSAVSKLPRRWIQLTMGFALLLGAALFLAHNISWIPSGGEALGLSHGRLAFATLASFILGALMMAGVGFYAPCLILVSLLGMNPRAAFPIMMGACALLMPLGGTRFIATRKYNLPAAMGLTLGGIPGVLIAALIVKSLPLFWLRWLVIVVVTYTSMRMLKSAFGRRGQA